MEILAFVILIFFLFFTKLFLSKRGKSKNLPPSPPSLPLIGHLHLLKEPIHRTLHQMVAKYGDVLLLRFGARNVVVVSSLSAATEEFFTKNDVALSNRPLSLAGKHLNYNHKTIGFSQYNDHWRSLRRLTVLELLSNTRIAKFSGIRHEEAQIMVKTLLQEHRPSSSTDESCHSQWTKVELRPKIVDLVFNIMMKMIAGKRYYGNEVVEEEARQFQSIMRELSELLENKNINDIFPVLQWIDFQGVEKRMIRLKNKMDNFFQRLIDEHRKNGTGKAKSDANDYERNMTFIELIFFHMMSTPDFRS
ncbi:hypothetical protein TIFTF001_004328 [Ficus carica]|uniref:Cytochrome P450 n=1 Tax=Ficus carica TaxID=3494 RepID=A0AA88CXP2_FICCA|nr:hypothetical protein TIFTF001_004328 [Ficus carica]